MEPAPHPPSGTARSRAQLNQMQAQIQQASAKYDYEAEFAALNFQLGILR